jgi:hypothetical protein
VMLLGLVLKPALLQGQYGRQQIGGRWRRDWLGWGVCGTGPLASAGGPGLLKAAQRSQQGLTQQQPFLTSGFP